MIRNMEGKVALVTGASSGIGQATAIVFAREGAKVTACANLNIRGGEETADLIKQSGGDAIFVQADVSQADQVERLIDKTVEVYGRIDFACNNAGIAGPRLPLTEFPEGEWNLVLDINLKSVWLCMKYEIPHMLRQGKGAIVNVSSDGGLKPMKGLTAYSPSKHGVIGLTRVAALEYAESGIRVNAVCPGPVKTPMLESVWNRHPEREALLISSVAMKRIGVPMEIAKAIVWLCSDAASYITGHALPVDGGSAELL
jgi:NAD(P)-dependent dehydrogenase (short-subunit alcohol dehydrogenase family)